MMEPKNINLKIHGKNHYRRVKYNDKSKFDMLIVNLNDGISERKFQIESKYLTDMDSIHLKYDPVSHCVSWSPKEISYHVVEVI